MQIRIVRSTSSYFYVFINERNYTFVLSTNITKKTYIKYKKAVVNVLKTIKSDLNNIDRLGVRVQLDESVVSRKGKIVCPTAFHGDLLNTVWLFAGCEEDNLKIFFKIAPNQTYEVLNLKKENI